MMMMTGDVRCNVGGGGYNTASSSAGAGALRLSASSFCACSVPRARSRMVVRMQVLATVLVAVGAVAVHLPCVHAAECPAVSIRDPDTGLCECHPDTFCGDNPLCSNGRFSADLCPECTCFPEPRVFEVLVEPEYHVGDAAMLRWASTAVDRVDLKLYRVSAQTPPRYIYVSDIATNAMNHGNFTWTVDVDVPGGNFSVLVASHHHEFVYTTSPPFVIVPAIQPPCPPGFQPRNGSSACDACARGSFSLGGNEQCTRCPANTTTTSTAAVSLDDCVVNTRTSVLAAFTRARNRTLTAPPLRTLTDVTMQACLDTCHVDALCAAAAFAEKCAEDKRGACSLHADNLHTALASDIQLSSAGPGSAVQLFFTKDAAPNPLSAFKPTKNARLTATVLRREQGPVSATACAARCLRSGTCHAVAAGVRSRFGNCTLYTQNTHDRGVDLLASPYYAFDDTDIYELMSSAQANPCPPGATSSTGFAPGCTRCPKHHYAAAPTLCSPCPPDAPYTSSRGAATVDACVPALCPSSATGPDQQGDCVCPQGTSCVGSGCQRSDDDRWFFSATDCEDCECTTATRPPLIDFVLTPKTGSVHYTGDTLEVRWVSSSSFQFVDILLSYKHPSQPNTVVVIGYIAYKTRNDGLYKWQIPTDFPSRTDYAIIVVHNVQPGEPPAPTHRNTGFFSILPAPLQCPPGTVNTATGRPPCEECPVGTYSATTAECRACPNGTTTYDDGSPSVESCVVPASSALSVFVVYPQQWLETDALAGYYLEVVDHKTLEECAQLCLDDAGCKSMVAGVLGSHQEGDCFLSYSNLDNIGLSELRPIQQLSYYERPAVRPVLTTDLFRGFRRCFLDIDGTPRGGVFSASPESCAQACLHDPCCLGFHTDGNTLCEVLHSVREGASGTATNSSSAGVEAFGTTASLAPLVCDPSVVRTYYERRQHVRFSTGVPVSAANSQLASSVLSQALQDAVEAVVGGASDAGIFVATRPDPDNGNATLLADVDVPLPAQRSALEDAVRAGSLSVVWPPVVGDVYAFAFTPHTGPCPAGTVSATGNRDYTCMPCRPNTYASRSRTRCVACPAGLVSHARSSLLGSCVRPSNSSDSNAPAEEGDAPATTASSRSPLHYFEAGDVWSGSYAAAKDRGSMSLEVERVSVGENGTPRRVSALMTLRHNRPCDPARGCRTPGLSMFYVRVAAENETTLSMRYVRGFDGWGGITDRSYPRQDLVATITLAAGKLRLRGDYRPGGSFSMHRVCGTSSSSSSASSSGNGVEIGVGTHFTGTMVCGVNDNSTRAVATATSETDKGALEAVTTRRLDLYVESVGDTLSAVRWLVDFDHQYGSSQFLAEGFLQQSQCQSFAATPTANAWVTKRVPGVSSFQLTGRQSDDGTVLTGQVSNVPACACATDLPPELGSTCGRFGANDAYCFVDQDCPEAEPSPFPGWLFTDERQEEHACQAFSLSYVCTDQVGLCAPGWTHFRNKCYRAAAGAVSFSEARDLCSLWDATLTSVHSTEEEAIVLSLSNGTGAWLGLQLDGASTRWLDGSPFLYSNWNASTIDLTQTSHCAYLSPGRDGGGLWRLATCNASGLTAVCRSPVLAADHSCACTSPCRASAQEQGVVALCETHSECPRAVLRGEDGAHVVVCDFGDSPLLPPALNVSCHQANSDWYTQGDGTCGRCLQASDCGTNAVLIGECGEMTSPRCVSCPSGCDRCDVVDGAPTCLRCQESLVLSSVTRQCRVACEDGYFTNTTDRTCRQCAPSCRTCAGPTAKSCTSCSPSQDLFLLASHARGSDVSNSTARVGECSPSCPPGSFKDRSSYTCEPCTSCDANTAYTVLSCTEFADAVCAALSVCEADEVEVLAPTATSDRVCVPAEACATGTERTANNTCVFCPPGTTDDDLDPETPCMPCPPGTFAAEGTSGTCSPCDQGTADDDANASTPCTECSLGSTYQDELGQVSCKPVAACEPGTFLVLNASTTRNTRCRQCPARTFSDQRNAPRCHAWTTCPVGQEPTQTEPSASSDRACAPCGNETYKPAVGNFACFNATPPCVLSEEVRPPTPTSDRECRACATNTFFSAEQQACVPVTACNSTTQYQQQGPTSSTDRVCADVTACKVNQEFETSAPTATTDRVCQQLAVCGKDEYESTAPSIDGRGIAVSDRICVGCTKCPTGTVRACNATSDAVCGGGCNTTCEAGVSFESSPCTPESDRVCSPCGKCDDNEYAAVPCTPNANTTCVPLSTCDVASGREYEAQPGTSTSDRTCGTVSTCKQGFGVVQAPTPTSDRTCAACESGVTFSSRMNSVCARVSMCGAGEYEVIPPSPTNDRVCAPCPHNTYRSSGMAACVPFTTCVPGEYVAALPTPTSDRVCKPCGEGEYSAHDNSPACVKHTACGAGTYVSELGGTSTDQVCAECPASTFSNTSNSAGCTEHRVCPAGTHRVGGTRTVDVTCVPCADGTFSSAPNADACTQHRTCAPGTRVALSPTATRDRLCAPCREGTWAGATNAEECRAVSTCPPGTAVAAAPTASSDRKCRSCKPYATFQSGSNQPTCLRVRAPCAAGTFEAQPPTTSSDRVCKPCNTTLGAFQPLKGQRFCAVSSGCTPGEYVAQEVTRTSDVVCSPCAPGTFSTRGAMIDGCEPCTAGTSYQPFPGGTRCFAVTQCPVGHVESMPPTPTSDRVCQLCDGVSFYFDPTRDACQPVRQCTGLEETVAPATHVSNTVCRCDTRVAYEVAVPHSTTAPMPTNGTTSDNSDGGGVPGRGVMCMPLTECSADDYEVRSPSRTSDRLCAAGTVVPLQFVFESLSFDLVGDSAEAFMQRMDALLNEIAASALGSLRGVRVFTVRVRRGSTIVESVVIHADQARGGGSSVVDTSDAEGNGPAGDELLFEVRDVLEERVAAGEVVLAWPMVNGTQYAANFTAQRRPCPIDTFSATGYAPCQSCPLGFVHNAQRTQCADCTQDSSMHGCDNIDIPTVAGSGGSKAAVPAVAIVFICIIAGSLVGAGIMYLVRGKSKVRVVVVPDGATTDGVPHDQREKGEAGTDTARMAFHNPLYGQGEAFRRPRSSGRAAWEEDLRREHGEATGEYQTLEAHLPWHTTRQDHHQQQKQQPWRDQLYDLPLQDNTTSQYQPLDTSIPGSVGTTSHYFELEDAREEDTAHASAHPRDIDIRDIQTPPQRVRPRWSDPALGRFEDEDGDGEARNAGDRETRRPARRAPPPVPRTLPPLTRRNEQPSSDA